MARTDISRNCGRHGGAMGISAWGRRRSVHKTAVVVHNPRKMSNKTGCRTGRRGKLKKAREERGEAMRESYQGDEQATGRREVNEMKTSDGRPRGRKRPLFRRPGS